MAEGQAFLGAAPKPPNSIRRRIVGGVLFALVLAVCAVVLQAVNRDPGPDQRAGFRVWLAGEESDAFTVVADAKSGVVAMSSSVSSEPSVVWTSDAVFVPVDRFSDLDPPAGTEWVAASLHDTRLSLPAASEVIDSLYRTTKQCRIPDAVATTVIRQALGVNPRDLGSTLCDQAAGAAARRQVDFLVDNDVDLTDSQVAPSLSDPDVYVVPSADTGRVVSAVRQIIRTI